MGPGGGGGGGHVLLQAATSTCPIKVSSGVAGTNVTAIDAGDPSFGAFPLTPLVGVVETLAGGYVP